MVSRLAPPAGPRREDAEHVGRLVGPRRPAVGGAARGPTRRGVAALRLDEALHEGSAGRARKRALERRGRRPRFRDLAFLRVRPGGEDGLDVLNFIKTHWPKHPVIIFTGVSDDEFFIKKALADRAEGFVRKMAGLPAVLATVREVLPKRSPTGSPKS